MRAERRHVDDEALAQAAIEHDLSQVQRNVKFFGIIDVDVDVSWPSSTTPGTGRFATPGPRFEDTPRCVAAGGLPCGAIPPVMYDPEDDEDDDRETADEEMDADEDACWNTVMSDFTAEVF
jgi:hypothetical protein